MLDDAIFERLLPMARRALALSVLTAWTAAAAPVAADLLSFYHEDSDELELVNFRPLRWELIPPGLVEVEFEADVENLDSATWGNAQATWVFENPLLEVVDGLMSFGPVAPLGITAADDSMILRLPMDRATAFRDALLGGQIDFQIGGSETTVFSGPSVFLDEETDSAFRSFMAGGAGDEIWTFDYTTALLDSLQQGDMMLFDRFLYDPQTMDRSKFPAEVLSVTLIDPEVEVEVRFPLTFDELIMSGTFVPEGLGSGDPLHNDTSYETTLDEMAYFDEVSGCVDESHLPDPDSGRAGDPMVCSWAALPLRFNDVDFGQGVTLSGQVLLRSTGIDLTLSFRDGVVKLASTAVEAGVTATLHLEAEQSAIIPATEQTLMALTTPVYAASIGGFPITIGLTLDLLLGVEGELTAGTKINAHQQATAGLEMGCRDGCNDLSGDYFAELIAEVAPLDISPPRLTDDSQAHGRVWAAAEAGLVVNGLAGTFVRAAPYGELLVSPVENPWWMLAGGLEASGGFELSLLGIEIARWDAPLFDERLEGKSGQRPESELMPTSGDEVRWAVALHDGAGSGGHTRQQVTALADGGVLIVGENTTAGYMIKLDGRGDPIWEKDLGGSPRPRKSIELPGGNLMIAGDSESDVWIARHDADGNRLDSVSYAFDDGCDVQDFFGFLDDQGQPAYLLVGRSTLGFISQRDPCLVRLDTAGNVVWAKRYPTLQQPDGAEWPYAAVETSDGDFALVGRTDADVGGDLGKDESNAMVMKVDASGTPLWARAVGSKWGLRFEALTEAADGTLILAGGIGIGVINDGYPSLAVAKIGPDGSDLEHALIAQDFEWEDAIDSRSGVNAPPWTPTDGGDTPYDMAHAIVPGGGGFIVVGTTGLGDDRAVWAFELTEELGVQWMTTFDGPLNEEFWSIADAGDGWLIAGDSRSFVPLGTGGTSAVLAMKLPYDGLLDFDPAAASVSRFIQPLIYPSVDEPDFVDSVSLDLTADIVFDVVDIGWTDGEPLPAMTDATSTVTWISE